MIGQRQGFLCLYLLLLTVLSYANAWFVVDITNVCKKKNLVVRPLLLSPTTMTTRRRPSHHDPSQARHHHHGTFITVFFAHDSVPLDDADFRPLIPIVLTVALALGVAAQGWIQRMIMTSSASSRRGRRDDDRQEEGGLGAYLRDGRGYSKSGFKLSDTDRAVSSDPLPWLSLPKLDFVEVAGQEQQQQEEQEKLLLGRLETLRQTMNDKIKQGNQQEAEQLRIELEQLMEENDVDFSV